MNIKFVSFIINNIRPKFRLLYIGENNSGPNFERIVHPRK